MTESIIPFKGRNSSFAFDTNLLVRNGQTYVMDNHKMALWCWCQHFKHNERYLFVHIDKHYDTIDGGNMGVWIKNIDREIEDMSAEEYNKIEYEYDKGLYCPVFRWDNYLSIFYRLYPERVKHFLFFTHHVGDTLGGLEDTMTHFSEKELKSLGNLINKGDNVIVNLDIDYFFNENGALLESFNETEIIEILDDIHTLTTKSPKNILTIALSPECCGGWGKSISFFEKYATPFGVTLF